MVLCLLAPLWLSAQQWTDPVRGSWASDTAGVPIFDGNSICQIELSAAEQSPVRQAAKFLASDIEKLTGHKPPIVEHAEAGRATIHLRTAVADQIVTRWPWSFPAGAWEAYQIDTGKNDIFCVGSDARGSAFAVYTLSERLGIDPLYIWTGYVPLRHEKLFLKETHFHAGPPTFRFRGMFHDDEDILPRPFEMSGYPFRLGDVPDEWYARFFETALRLRMNMVAPWTRVHRRYEVQKMASDWGLFYTSHHYDILLSNPFGFTRYGLGEKRNAGTDWDWQKNRQGMLNYWRGGVEENKDLDCVWPVGLRGTDDHAYTFPKDMPDRERERILREAIEAQVQMVKSILPAGKPAYFPFTMYNEVLENYLKNPAAFAVPEDVTLVWPDDNDGRIRYLPENLGKWKHGIYYHLAYLGPVPKQSAHIVTPAMVAREFKKVVDAGATDYMLVNVSELREFVMEARMIGEICWDAKTALADMPQEPRPAEPKAWVPAERGRASTAASQPASNPAADRYVGWWCHEYFGDEAAPLAVEGYHRYYELLNAFDKAYFGSSQVQAAIDQMERKIAGKPFKPFDEATISELKKRDQQFADAFTIVGEARAKMSRPQRQFFHNHVELPMLMDWRPTQAAILLAEALKELDAAKSWELCEQAMKPLEELEVEILRAEHPPFELWYRKTWIRRENSDLNVHRPFEQLRVFLSSGGKEKLQEPPNARRPVFPVRRE